VLQGRRDAPEEVGRAARQDRQVVRVHRAHIGGVPGAPERVVKPLLLEKKVSYSKRAGAESDVEYIYSEDESVDIVRFYKWDRLAREWKQIEMADIGR
jgi:hypothetical protein